MKVLKKNIAINFLTLGLSGYLSTKRLLEANGFKQRIHYSDHILGFMLALSIISALTVCLGVLESFELWANFLYEPSELSALETDRLNFLDSVFWFPNCFIFFTILHLFLGIAFVQHANGLSAEDRLLVLWFGFYALDCDLSDFTTDVESADPEEIQLSD